MTTPLETLFWFLLAFQLKHLLADFFLQFPYMYKNKGIYLHKGGIDHALMHGVGTLTVVGLFQPTYVVLFFAVVFDTVAHYHIDWAKVNICKKYKWGPETSDDFWMMLGIDQFLHQLTYILIVLAVLK